MAGVIGLGLLFSAWKIPPLVTGMVRERVIRVLESHFGAKLELQKLDVQIFPTIRIRGEGLVFRETPAPDVPPLVTIQELVATTSFLGGRRRPPRVEQVRLDGLRIQVSRRGGGPRRGNRPSGKHVPDFVLGHVSADGTVLVVIPRDERKPPLQFNIRRLQLWSAGTTTPMSFQATLTNAKPPGDIQTTGKFGPWDKEDAGETAVSGNYIFRDADLSVFRGIAGKLASDGVYRGKLDRIEVDGKTDVPDFTLKVSGNPIHLRTQFHAIVDGTDGDTALQPVDARFGQSRAVARGGVEGEKGAPGKTVSLDVTTEGRIEDMLRLGAKGAKPALRGAIRFQAKLIIPPGDVDIADKLRLNGRFALDSARFTNLDLQEKISALSRRGQGHPKAAPQGTVASEFNGRFELGRGELKLEPFSFRIPGVAVNLNGSYGLRDEQLDFHGTARLDAKLSSTTTGFKSLLLRAVDPFFEKGNAGAVIPIKIEGTREKPAVGLDLRRKRH